MSKRKIKRKLSTIIILLIAIASWAIFDLTKTLFIKLLNIIGINDYVTQLIILIIIIIIILSMLGVSYYKIIKRL